MTQTAGDKDKDLTALLVEAQTAVDAVRHGMTGVRFDVDRLREAKRLQAALEASERLAEQAYPGSRSRE